MTRREFLKRTAALIATGMLPVASVRAAWKELPPEPEPEGVSVWGSRAIEYGPDECKRLFGEDDFECELIKKLTEEMAKEITRDIDRMFIGLVPPEASELGWARQVFPVDTKESHESFDKA
jgi:hypothetical protein